MPLINKTDSDRSANLYNKLAKIVHEQNYSELKKLYYSIPFLNNALANAVHTNNLRLIFILHYLGASTESNKFLLKNGNYGTIIHFALEKKNFAAVNALLRVGVNPFTHALIKIEKGAYKELTLIQFIKTLNLNLEQCKELITIFAQQGIDLELNSDGFSHQTATREKTIFISKCIEYAESNNLSGLMSELKKHEEKYCDDLEGSASRLAKGVIDIEFKLIETAIKNKRGAIATTLLLPNNVQEGIRLGLDGGCILEAALSMGDLPIIKQLIETIKLDIKAPPTIFFQDSALVRAIRHDKLDVVNLLLKYDGKKIINLPHDITRRTPLMFAVETGNSKMVDLLLKNGADPKMVDDLGFSAIDFALEGPIKNLLLRHENSVNESKESKESKEIKPIQKIEIVQTATVEEKTIFKDFTQFELKLNEHLQMINPLVDKLNNLYIFFEEAKKTANMKKFPSSILKKWLEKREEIKKLLESCKEVKNKVDKWKINILKADQNFDKLVKECDKLCELILSTKVLLPRKIESIEALKINAEKEMAPKVQIKKPKAIKVPKTKISVRPVEIKQAKEEKPRVWKNRLSIFVDLADGLSVEESIAKQNMVNLKISH